MFAFVAVFVLGAMTLASCGGDDDDNGNTPKNTYKIVCTIDSKRADLEGYEKYKEKINATTKELNNKYSNITITDDITAASIWSQLMTPAAIKEMQEIVDETADLYNDPTLVITLKLMKNDNIIQQQIWRPTHFDVV